MGKTCLLARHGVLCEVGKAAVWEEPETGILMFPGLLPFKLRMGGEETLFRFYYMIY